MKDIAPNIKRKRLIFEGIYRIDADVSIESVKKYLTKLSEVLDMKIVYGPLVNNWAEQKFPDQYDGCEAWVMWAESGTQLYVWEKDARLITVDIYTCNDFSLHKAIKFTSDYFQCQKYEFYVLPKKQDNKNILIRKNEKGIGVYVIKNIAKGEFITGFYGDIYTAESALKLPEVAKNRAIQFAEKKWRMSNSAGDNLNHSCNPNCGIKDLFNIVAMRDIKVGEELTFDYSMSENSDWELPNGKCLCGSKTCREKVGTYAELSGAKKKEYEGYISEWLIKN